MCINIKINIYIYIYDVHIYVYLYTYVHTCIYIYKYWYIYIYEIFILYHHVFVLFVWFVSTDLTLVCWGHVYGLQHSHELSGTTDQRSGWNATTGVLVIHGPFACTVDTRQTWQTPVCCGMSWSVIIASCPPTFTWFLTNVRERERSDFFTIAASFRSPKGLEHSPKLSGTTDPTQWLQWNDLRPNIHGRVSCTRDTKQTWQKLFCGEMSWSVTIACCPPTVPWLLTDVSSFLSTCERAGLFTHAEWYDRPDAMAETEQLAFWHPWSCFMHSWRKTKLTNTCLLKNVMVLYHLTLLSATTPHDIKTGHHHGASPPWNSRRFVI